MASDNIQIVPFYAHPHVHSVITDNTFYDETTAPFNTNVTLPYSTLCVTGADQGIDNTLVCLKSLTEKNAIFGKANWAKYGQASIQADANLENGNTAVWFCRVLPDNATYANMVVMAHYRKRPILDSAGNDTGLVRMDIKFSTAYANKPRLIEGATTVEDIMRFANGQASDSEDALTGFMSVPLFFVRSNGRGRYGNYFSMSVTRDKDAEKDYGVKMYSFNLFNNKGFTRQTGTFVGSLVQSSLGNDSTLISDVIDQYDTGVCPIQIHPFEDSMDKLYEFYRDEVVMPNAMYLQNSGSATDAELTELGIAQNIVAETFDPIFGYQMDTQEGDIIPYYRNYTVTSVEGYIPPDLEIGNDGSTKPLNISDWTTAFVGATVVVVSDPLNGGARWKYTIASIDEETGNILYDEGEECQADEDQYDGLDLTVSVGHMLNGGHDGDFQEISVNGEMRAPTSAEMKLLLSREYVKVLRGQRDRKILSPSRVDLDFIFDANYNMLTGDNLMLDSSTVSMYSNSSVITDQDATALATLGKSGFVFDMTDINVKKALYDLNQFRNKNGQSNSHLEGAGCSLYLDCGIIGLKNINVNTELYDIIKAFQDYTGRATSVDLGYYEIYEPNTGKKVKVTTSYFLAKNLVNHLMRKGMEAPFVGTNAMMSAYQKSANKYVGGEMIRGTFKPDIDDIDWDVKEFLFKSRINYYITEEEGRVVKRAVQNTRQTDASALLEENNVRVLNKLKKGLEKSCRSYLYAWNEPEVRKAFTDSQMDIYRPWIGQKVQYLDIKFEANEWEQERMIMHCYVVVKFRDIIKRIILEININRPEY